MSKIQETKIVEPRILSFERKLDISDAIFYQTSSKSDNKEILPLIVTDKTVRGTKSYSSATEKDQRESNPQRVDEAKLDSNKDTLVVKWSLKAIPFNGLPSSCDELSYRARIEEIVGNYLESNSKEGAVLEIIRRYVINIINGRWLWRNRLASQAIDIVVTLQNNEEILFKNAKALLLNSFSENDYKEYTNEIKTIALEIQKGLLGKNPTIINVEARVIIGAGLETYPSQEFIDAPKTKAEGQKSKALYSREGNAAMHSQKIGNAIRTIDDWYPEAEFPIAIEPFGTVTTMGEAFRGSKHASKKDLYTLLKHWILGQEDKLEERDKHYVIANLIRGGVFQ